MITNKKGIELIKTFEGLKLKPYLCSANVPTIGYGSTFYEDGKKVTLKDLPISEQRAEELLKNTLASFENGVTKLIKVPVSENEFSALVSFAFNVGLSNLKHSTLLRLLNFGLPRLQVAEQFARWNKAAGKELKGLTRRREAEKQLFLSKS